MPPIMEIIGSYDAQAGESKIASSPGLSVDIYEYRRVCLAPGVIRTFFRFGPYFASFQKDD